MGLHSWINSIGLAFDILGVILLFFYEPPKETFGILLESAPSEEERMRTFMIKRRYQVLWTYFFEDKSINSSLFFSSSIFN